MKVKSEHHKVSGSSSAKAHRIRAANLPSHRLSEIQRSEVVRFQETVLGGSISCLVALMVLDFGRVINLT